MLGGSHISPLGPLQTPKLGLSQGLLFTDCHLLSPALNRRAASPGAPGSDLTRVLEIRTQVLTSADLPVPGVLLQSRLGKPMFPFRGGLELHFLSSGNRMFFHA